MEEAAHRRHGAAPDVPAEPHGRFDCEDGSTRLAVSFEVKGPAKTVVTVAHGKLPAPDDAETMKAMWRERLAELRALLEG